MTLQQIRQELHQCSKGKSVELVAVSKTFPIERIQEAYDQGQRHFGENYVQELLAKQALLPKDIIWHYIGALQSNKLQALASVPGIVIETLDSTEKAARLNKYAKETIKVFIQVNTSKEEQKHGLEKDQVHVVAKFIEHECPKLELRGLMTIGSDSHDVSVKTAEFHVLSECRDLVETELGTSGLGLSMGMSADYKLAVEMGSTNVRIGSAIFGVRRV